MGDGMESVEFAASGGGIDTDRLDPHFVATFVRADTLAAPAANTHGA